VRKFIQKKNRKNTVWGEFLACLCNLCGAIL